MDRKNEKAKLDVIVGRNIRYARDEHKMSREELAKMMGMTQSHMGLMERGERGATAVSLSKLAKIFDKPVDSFFKDAAHKKKSVWVDEEPEAQVYRNRIKSIITLLSAKDLSIVVHLVKGLVAADEEAKK